MDDDRADEEAVARIAAAIGEPARARMLYSLMDGRARTSTELAAVADVGLPTASAHLAQLKDRRLVQAVAQGKHRYYSLAGPDVARALEGLSVLAGGARPVPQPRVPVRLKLARTCYDHMAGTLGVGLTAAFEARGWIAPESAAADGPYVLPVEGAQALRELGVDVEKARGARRRFAYGCLDWSERRPHLGGSLGSAVLGCFLERGWVQRELDSRALEITDKGSRALRERFGLEL